MQATNSDPGFQRRMTLRATLLRTMECIVCKDDMSDVDELASPIDFFILRFSLPPKLIVLHYARHACRRWYADFEQFRPQLLMVNNFSNQCLPRHVNCFGICDA